MSVNTRVILGFSRSIEDSYLERILEALDRCEDQGRIADVDVTGALRRGHLEIEFELIGGEDKSFRELRDLAKQIVEDAVGVKFTACEDDEAQIPAAHVIESMWFGREFAHQNHA